MRAALPLLFFSLPLFGAEITPWDRLKDAATEFIKARSETKQDAAWEKSWKTRLEDRMESTRLSRDAVAQAQERRRIVRNRYDAGVIGANDVLAATTAALEAEAQRVGAVVDLLVAHAELQHALGRPASSSR